MRHLLALVLTSALDAQSFYVNGATGTDLPSRGLSAQLPWRTIGYALKQIPATVASARLYVAGDQDYAPTTNGEKFPIVPAPNVWIEGSFAGHGQMPVLRPVTGTAVLFDPNVDYDEDKVTIRYREDSGALPFDLGAFGAPGSLPWNDVAAVLGVQAVDSLGASSRTFSIPASGALVGRAFTLQWWVLSSFANRLGTVTSDGLRVTIGR